MIAPGVALTPGYLDRAAQDDMLTAVRAVIAAAPLYLPRMPRSGKPMSVHMTNCGPLGWVTDSARGYRYQGTHPETGAPWPPIPEIILKAWRDLGGYPHPLSAKTPYTAESEPSRPQFPETSRSSGLFQAFPPSGRTLCQHQTPGDTR